MDISLLGALSAWTLNGSPVCHGEVTRMARGGGARAVTLFALNVSDACAAMDVRSGVWQRRSACARTIEAGIRVWEQPGVRVQLTRVLTGDNRVVTFGVDDDDMSPSTLAVTRLKSDDATTTIKYRSTACWHTHDVPCAALAGLADAVRYAVLVVSCGVMMLLGVVCMRRSSLARDHCVVACAGVILAINVCTHTIGIACAQCHSLAAVTAHEVGHVLGFGHPDQVESQVSGCAANAVCTEYRPISSLMRSTLSKSWNSDHCLSEDDVAGLYTIYGVPGGLCPPRHIPCPQSSSWWAVTALCSLAVVWLIGLLVLNTCWCLRRHAVYCNVHTPVSGNVTSPPSAKIRI